MKKISLIIFAILFSNNVNAEGFFDKTLFGISFISQRVDIEHTLSGVTTNETDSGSGFGLYLDNYYKKSYRFNSTLSYVTYDTFEISQIMFSADYLLPINERISFFGGVAAGGAFQSYTESSLTDGASGAVYGAQLGAIGFVNNSIMLELGYRFRPSSGIETEFIIDGSMNTLTDLSEAYFSILLMF